MQWRMALLIRSSYFSLTSYCKCSMENFHKRKFTMNYLISFAMIWITLNILLLVRCNSSWLNKKRIIFHFFYIKNTFSLNGMIEIRTYLMMNNGSGVIVCSNILENLKWKLLIKDLFCKFYLINHWRRSIQSIIVKIEVRRCFEKSIQRWWTSIMIIDFRR